MEPSDILDYTGADVGATLSEHILEWNVDVVDSLRMGDHI
jgi:hypothetical protein